jgi:hypothetical protein
MELKSVFKSRVFWLNVVGFGAEVLANQTFLALPFIKPAWTPHIAFIVFILNVVIRMEGGVPPFRVRQ